jgi:hypothetical protein
MTPDNHWQSLLSVETDTVLILPAKLTDQQILGQEFYLDFLPSFMKP